MEGTAEDIFAEVLEIDPALREEFLERVCAGDAALRQAVDGLLADAARADTFFAEMTRGAEGLPARGPSEEAGTWIGPYKLIQKIGAGGFGVVWMAQQEKPIIRRVALKVIRGGMDTEEVLARFEAERQALARMEHPNIARVLDAGATPGGRPYFAMELVAGHPITEYCDARQLGTEARLRLFSDVCVAVNHAHQKGVIHRDIKPSNVLITVIEGHPVVKVIDFGIAKATEGRLTDHTLVTRIEQFVGTPAYMSPEQAGLGGLDIDTRSDIYSLGALLYELLTGVAPFEKAILISAGYEETRRIVREVEPPRPSLRLTSLSASELSKIAAARRLPSGKAGVIIPCDLDWIVMKALEKSRERRYPSADAFVEDMRRFIANEPVTARPPSAWYLVGKFARRHAAGLLMAAGSAAVLLAAAGISTWQGARALKAEALAEARLKEVTGARELEAQAKEDAEAVAQFFQRIFEMPDPETNGRDIKLADALDASAAKIEIEFAAQPRRRALFEQTLGGTYAKLGMYPPAVASLRKALASYKKAGEIDADAVVATLGELTALLTLLGHYEEASELGTRHIELLQKTKGATSRVVQEATTGRNQNWFASGRRDEAVASQEALVASMKIAFGGEDPQTLASKDALNDLLKRAKTEKPTRAFPDDGHRPPKPVEESPDQLNKKNQTQLEKLERNLAEAQLKSGVNSLQAFEARSSLAWFLGMSGRREEGTLLMREAMEKLTTKYGETHAYVLKAEGQWAYFLWRTRQSKDARAAWSTSLKKRKEIFGPRHLETLMDQAAFADALLHAGYLDEAISLAAEAVDILREVSGKSRELHHAMGILSRCRMGEGQWWQALELLEECAPNMPDDTFVNRQLAELQVWFKRQLPYEETRSRMLAATPRIWADRNNRADVYDRTAVLACLAPLKDAAQAEAVSGLLKRSEELRANPEAVMTRRDPELAALARCLAAYRLGSDAGVQAAYEESLRIVGSRKIVSTRPLALDLIQAMSLARRGNDAEARQLFRDATATTPPLPAADEVFVSRPPAGGYPVLLWILHREASHLLSDSPTHP